MWSDDDFACKEEKHAKPQELWTDSKGFTRKLMPTDAFCTVQCPKKRWWTQRSERIMICKQGMWVDFLGSPIEKIECGTASWCLVLALLLVGTALGLCVNANKNKKDGSGLFGDSGRSASTLGSSSEDVAAALEHAHSRDQMQAAASGENHSTEYHAQQEPPAPAHETEGEI